MIVLSLSVRMSALLCICGCTGRSLLTLPCADNCSSANGCCVIVCWLLSGAAAAAAALLSTLSSHSYLYQQWPHQLLIFVHLLFHVIRLKTISCTCTTTTHVTWTCSLQLVLQCCWLGDRNGIWCVTNYSSLQSQKNLPEETFRETQLNMASLESPLWRC